MTSPENAFQPPEFSAPKTGSDDATSGSAEDPQANSMTAILEQEQISPSPRYFLISSTQNHLFPSTAIEREHQGLQVTELPSAVGETSPNRREPWGEAKTERRRVWEETGYIPPIAGGSPRRRIDLPLDLIRQRYYEGESIKAIAQQCNVSPETIRERLAEIHQQIPTREEAKAFIEARFTEEWPNIRQFQRIQDEVFRLHELYPDLYREVVNELKAKLRS